MEQQQGDHTPATVAAAVPPPTEGRAAESSPATPAESGAPGPRRMRRHVLQQATVATLDEDGRLAAAVGTVAFAIATLFVLGASLGQPRGSQDVPLWVCLAGLGLGLIFLAYCELRVWNRSLPDDAEATPTSSPSPDA